MKPAPVRPRTRSTCGLAAWARQQPDSRPSTWKPESPNGCTLSPVRVTFARPHTSSMQPVAHRVKHQAVSPSASPSCDLCALKTSVSSTPTGAGLPLHTQPTSADYLLAPCLHSRVEPTVCPATPDPSQPGHTRELLC